MSTTRYDVNESVETETLASREDFLRILKNLDKSLSLKLEALSDSLKGTKAYTKDGTIFIKDTWGNKENLQQELSAFGFTVVHAGQGMYKVADSSSGLLDLLEPGSLKSAVCKTLKIDETLAEKIKMLKGIELPEIEALKNNPKLMEIIESLRSGQNFTATDNVKTTVEEYASDYENFREKSRAVERDNNIKDGKIALGQLNNVIAGVSKNHHPNMINGKEVLYTNNAQSQGFTVSRQVMPDGKILLTLVVEEK